MLELKNIQKRYDYHKVLQDINMSFPSCGMVSIVGPSGCGKSTLLHIIGGIDQDFLGDLLWQGKSVKKHLTKYRRQHVSFIFQQFHLIMWLSVKQNIALPQFFHPQEKQQILLDMQAFENASMSSLSLGQRQRIAYLRTRYHKSDILLCDEPTGSLDPIHAKEIMELLKEEAKQRLVILVSHDQKLVEKYSDEIYEMKDGQIIAHHVYRQSVHQDQMKKKTKRIFFPHLRLSIESFLSHKKRSLQLVFGLTLSLLCIVFTLTLSQNLENQIHQYIHSLFPASSISFQSMHHQSLTIELLNQIQAHPDIIKAEMYLDDYECLGMSFIKERYQESTTLFIGDETSPYEDLSLKLGRFPQNQHEILVSLSTAQHLCQNEDISLLIDKAVYVYYQHGLEVKPIAFHVVGITSQTTSLDTFYQQNHASYYLLKEVYQFPENPSASLGIMYVDKNKERKTVLDDLQKTYPTYQFKEVGASTTQNISQTMKQVRIVLYIFSILAILSSLFLIGEVMFLNVVQKKKDLAIMKCFGASPIDIMKIVLYESLEIVLFAQLICTLLYYEAIEMMNQVVKEVLLNHQFVFSFDIRLLLIVFGVTYLFVLISQIPPLIYVLKINTVESLKE